MEFFSEAPREQAGSESYNRFEYQVHFSAFHLFDNIFKNKDFIMFCEYHEDMASSNDKEYKNFDFYQVKTKDTVGKWTLNKLLARRNLKDKKKGNSFLGLLFLNFLKFNQCKACFFVTNSEKEFDEEVCDWQVTIKDGLILKDEKNGIFEKIRKNIKEETKDLQIKKFDELFKKFIQNTFLYSSDLPLSNYEVVTQGFFFNSVPFASQISMESGLRLYRDVIDEVRMKSKCKLPYPVSKKEILEKKSISNYDIDILKSKLSHKFNDSLISEGVQQLISNNEPAYSSRLISNQMKEHYKKSSDPNEVRYNSSIISWYEIIEETIEEFSIDEINDNVNIILDKGERLGLEKINKYLMKGLIYEIISDAS